MSKIELKIKPQLELPKIEMPIELPGNESGIEDGTATTIKQTDIYGIQCPLVCLNGVTINYADLKYFELDCTHTLPDVSVIFFDRNNKFKNFVRTLRSNTLQVQILPPFDDAYKKINLLFYVYDYQVRGSEIQVRGQYKSPELQNDKIFSFGDLTTYELCETISSLSKLGFASNVSATKDRRHIDSRGNNLLDVLDSEITRSQADGQTVLEAWIDQFNCVNLCNMIERFNSVDPEEDLCVWIADTSAEDMDKDSDVKGMPAFACFNNVATMNSEEFGIDRYEVENDNTSFSSGSDKVLMAYSIDKTDAPSGYVYLGDNNQNKTISVEYLGEYYGGYNYLFASKFRSAFYEQQNNEILHVFTHKPSLSIMRGNQVRVIWVDRDSNSRYWRDQLEELMKNTNTTSAGELGWIKEWMDSVEGIDDNSMCVNLNISGQYTVIGQNIVWNYGRWEIETILVRPASKRITLLLPDTEENK